MSKIKRPEKVPSAINGTGVSVAGSPVSMQQPKKPPPILPPTSAISGASSINGIARNAGRPRRDVPGQMLGRGQRTAGSRTASVVADAQLIQAPQPQPYIRTDSYILKKYRGCPASLIVHLHPTHFRFDQQDGTFSYKSPMKIFIEHLRSRTVPQDLLEYFNQWDIKFYEGCLIVEVHNHKTVPNTRDSSQNSQGSEKSETMSIHNPRPWLTPSPWVPYPKNQLEDGSKSPETAASADGGKGKTAEEKDKENMPAPGQSSKGSQAKARISTLVLHPTQLSQYIDIAIKATTPVGGGNKRRESSLQDMPPLSASGTRPQTPMLAIPSTPNIGMEPPAKRLKREKMEIDAKNVYPIESQITLATTAPLFLEPTRSAGETIALLEALSHPDHSEPMPSPMMRKKTVAEMEAEDSAQKIEEQYMLTLDERYNAAAGGPGAADVDGQVGGTSFEPRFEKFKAIENIKLQVAENKKRERLQQAEAVKKGALEAEANKAKEEAEKKRLEEQQRINQLRLHQAQQQQQQIQAAHKATFMRQQMAAKVAQSGGAHGHPQPNMAGQNGAPGMNAQQQRFMQQNQISQAQAASPVPRNSTPQHMSSPMVGQNMGVPMQTSTSSMGGSPPRPGSVVPQGSQMSPLMAQAMRAQSSQQSHGGTPRLANGTPNMAHNMAAVNQTPRMTQPSPRAGQMAQAQQMSMLSNQNLDPQVRAHMQQQQQQHQQLAQQRMRLAAAQQAAGMGASSSPGNGQMTPQMAMQQQLAQQQMQANGMGQNPMTQQYTQQMRLMQAQHAAQAAQGQNGMQPNAMMGPRGAVTPQMVQQAQQQATLQAQQQGHMGQGNQQQAMMMQQKMRQMAEAYYQQGLVTVHAQYGPQPPPEVLHALKQKCQQTAMIHFRAQQQQRAMRAQQAQAQMMGAQGQMGMANGMGMNMGMQQGSPQGQMGMNGMHQMGGMQRPPGM